jgi:SAM-dependent methyltransferase
VGRLIQRHRGDPRGSGSSRGGGGHRVRVETVAEVAEMAVLERMTRSSRSVLSLNRNREFATLCRMLELNRGDSLLGVGSGDGYWTARFARRVAQVTGLEPDDTLLGCARRLHDGTSVRYEQGFGESLPFASGTFDKVVSVSSVEHFSDPVKGLEEMFRVLRAGGASRVRRSTSFVRRSPAGLDRHLFSDHGYCYHCFRYFAVSSPSVTYGRLATARSSPSAPHVQP